jgi:hypothetical protein
MKRLALLCLLLATGVVALAQQPPEWRPSLVDDNKAASWQDTKKFILGMLDASGLMGKTLESDDNCVLILPAARSDGPLGIRVAEESSGLVVLGVEPRSFAEYAGLRPGMHFLAANRRPIKTGADLVAFARTLKPGDDVVFEMRGSGGGSNILYLGGTLSKDGSYSDSKVTALNSIRVNFQLVDPLTVVVQNTTVDISGTNGQAIASYMDNGQEGKPVIREASVTLKDVESAKRTARAIMHLALLCGGAKAVSPF